MSLLDEPAAAPPAERPAAPILALTTVSAEVAAATAEMVQEPAAARKSSKRLDAARARLEAERRRADPRQTCMDVYGPFSSYKDEIMAMHIMHNYND